MNLSSQGPNIERLNKEILQKNNRKQRKEVSKEKEEEKKQKEEGNVTINVLFRNQSFI